jgi:hypothetical protein
MPTTGQLAFYDDSAQGWERALYAFLGEKQPTVYLRRLEGAGGPELTGGGGGDRGLTARRASV